MSVCGAGWAAPWEPEYDSDHVPCCMGSALDGPRGCTCWEPVYDIASQITPDTALRDVVRDRACADCAYRPDSPERQDGPEHRDVEELVASGDIFWCHQGIRHVVEYRHPDGRVHRPEFPMDYRPPIIGARPYKADGTPADVCAGWWARFEARDGARA